jgi:hypothetical protein
MTHIIFAAEEKNEKVDQFIKKLRKGKIFI